MASKNVIEYDLRLESDRRAMRNILNSIKPLKKYNGHNIPMDKLEKVIQIMTNKYNLSVKDIKLDCTSNDNYIIWRGTIYDSMNCQYYDVYGISIYEILAKLVTTMYSFREKAGERQVRPK